jgi:hypothetical protein
MLLGFASALVFGSGNACAQERSGASRPLGAPYQTYEPFPADGALQTDTPESKTDRPGWIVPYVGMDVGPAANYFGYGGVVFSPEGDLTKPSVVIRSFAGYGEFKYNSASVPGGRVKGDISMFDALIGYQTLGKVFRLGGYIGIEHQDIDLSPLDPTAKVKGAETGVKFLGEFETNDRMRFYLNATASYSTAFDTYRVQLRPGYRAASFIFGPEAVFQGNKGGDTQKVGGFVTLSAPISNGNYLGVTTYLGHAFSGKGNQGPFGGTGDGIYGGMIVSFFF